MDQAKRTLLHLIFIFITLFLVTVPRTGAQQDEPANAGLSLSAEAGFDGYYKGQFWLPVQVSVANNGPAIEGEIRLVTGTPLANDQLVYKTPISLPTQSNKRVTLFIAAPNSGSRTYTVELFDENGEVAARTMTNNTRLQNLDELLYGVVSSDPSDLDFLENVTGGRSDAAAAFLDVDDLPAVAAAWNALDILLFNDVDTGQLTADQIQALQGWVSTGGQLVVTGGPGWQKTAAAFSDMLPVTLTGSESVTDLPALSADIGFPFRDSGPYLLAASSLSSGEMLYHQDGLPLLAWQSWGRGAVYFLALDPKLAPLLDWDGSDVLFNHIANHVPEPPPWSLGAQSSYQAGEAVASLPSLALPSAAQLIVFLLIYVIIIGPINYIFLKRTGRRELAWITIPGLVVLFTATAYVTGFQLKGNETIINQLNIAFGQVNSEQMRTQSLIGLYSPRRGKYNLTLPADIAARPFERNFGALGGSGNLEAVTRGNDLVMTNVLVDVSDVEAFVADSYRPAPDISGQAQMNFNGGTVELAVTLQNNSDVALDNANLLVGSSLFSLGDLPPGDSFSNTFVLSRTSLASSSPSTFGPAPAYNFPLTDNADKILGTPNYYQDPVAYPRWQLLEALDGRYYGPGISAGNLPDNAATLIAWSDAAQLDIIVDDPNFNSLSTTLYFLEVPLQRALVSGNDLQIPATLLNWEAISMGGDVYEPSITGLYLNSNSWVEFEYRPWSEFADMAVTSLAIRLLSVDAGSSGPVPTIRLWDWEQEVPVDIEQVNWGNTNIPDFQRFLGPDNTVRLQVRSDSGIAVNISEIYPVLTGDLE